MELLALARKLGYPAAGYANTVLEGKQDWEGASFAWAANRRETFIQLLTIEHNRKETE